MKSYAFQVPHPELLPAKYVLNQEYLPVNCFGRKKCKIYYILMILDYFSHIFSVYNFPLLEPCKRNIEIDDFNEDDIEDKVGFVQHLSATKK